MRLLIFFLVLALPLPAATCKGEDPCKACRDCTRCKYCTSGKGSCGTCRDQTGPETAKREAKKAALRRIGPQK